MKLKNVIKEYLTKDGDESERFGHRSLKHLMELVVVVFI